MERERARFDILGRIDEERRARGWSEYQLAENAEICQSTLSTWRRKKLQPNVASIEKICAGFGITLSQFFHEGEENILSPEQRKLLKLWERLSPQQQRAFLELLESFLKT